MEWFCFMITGCLFTLTAWALFALAKNILSKKKDRPRKKILFESIVLLVSAAPLMIPNQWLLYGLRAGLETPGAIDGLVVLGGGLSRDGSLGITTTERLNKAVQLYRPGCTIFISGGPGTAPRMKDYLLEQGIERKVIVIDKSSFSTSDNVAGICPALRKKKISRAGIITSPYHSGRALRLFIKQCPGLKYFSFSTAPTKIFKGRNWLKVKTALICEGAKSLYSLLP
ncbi:MAG: YdcF family protein [Deltaproteobacteria bacterium]|nr:YdcF family protein [Deltaproteobacteria bacterium]